MPTKNITENLLWRANYNDGTYLAERDNTSITRKFSEIEMDKLISFDLFTIPKGLPDFLAEETFVVTENARGQRVKAIFQTFHTEAIPFFRLHLMPDQKLIFARRRAHHYSGSHSALFGYSNLKKRDKKIGNPKHIPRCDACRQLVGVKNVPYPLDRHNETVILVGWQRTVGGKNLQSINYIHPDGTIELSGEYGSDASHQPIKPFNIEQD